MTDSFRKQLPPNASTISRRQLLQRSACGMGWLAASQLLTRDATGAVPRTRGRADRVIMLFMAGGPSHIDTYDPKPQLTTLDGQQAPESIRKLFQSSAMQGNGTRKLMRSPFQFRRRGQCGLPASNLVEHTAEHIDDLCIVRSLQHDTVIHVPGEYVMTTGTITGDRPSMGAWVHYGLGTENDNLPAFVVLGGGPRPTYSAGFLPSEFQGTTISKASAGIPNLTPAAEMTPQLRRQQLNLIKRLNQQHLRFRGERDDELEARIRSYELAFRMQLEAPESFDLSQETKDTERLYGRDEKKTKDVAEQCMLARRLLERGVRFVQIRVDGWDSHDNLVGGHTAAAGKCDKPIAGLLSDLKRRGLFDSTLVVWGGEFGRTPGVEKKGGRDHSPGGFTMWLAGGGIKGGQAIGKTDDVGYTAVERVIGPNDFHATMLHALGVDQHQVSFTHRGRKEIPTFNGGRIVREAFL